MSKRQFKSQASSSRAGGAFDGGFGSSSFTTSHNSILSDVPDLSFFSRISDPNLGVAVKNLTKKDGTTKAKALEDLQTYIVSNDTEIEDALLDAWITLFPRLSVDPSRRVRQLSHGVNGHICAKCGKRTIKHMPRISGPWIAGTQDSDRVVSRAAQDALQLVFPSPEKVQNLRNAFQRPILEYCRDAALQESAKTLSDTRTTTAEDSEAMYARLVSSGLSVIATLAHELSPDEEMKCVDLHEEILSSEGFWSFVHSNDGGVRKAMHKLVQIYCRVHADLIQRDIRLASTAYVHKGLLSDQTGSVIDYEGTLTVLTKQFPDIWTSAYSGKKPALSRLKQFLSHGSQGSTATFWNGLIPLLRLIPSEVFPQPRAEIIETLASAKSGVCKQEDRFNAPSAWPAYFVLTSILISRASAEDLAGIFDESIMPLIRQYLEPNTETAEWTVAGPRPTVTISQVARIELFHPKLLSEWAEFGKNLIKMINASPPPHFNEFDRYQKQLASNGERWIKLQKAFFDGKFAFGQDSLETFRIVNERLLSECIGDLKTGSGKPYGSALVVEELIRSCGDQLLRDESFRTTYADFNVKIFPNMLSIPSMTPLMRAVYSTKDDDMIKETSAAIIAAILTTTEADDWKIEGLKTMYSANTPSAAIDYTKENQVFQDFIAQHVSSTSTESAIALFAQLIKLGAVFQRTTDAVLSDLTSALNVTDQQSQSLVALELIANVNERTMRDFVSQPGQVGEHLLPQLLQLEQSADDSIAEKANTLASRLSSVIGGASDGTKYGVIMQNLERVSPRSLTIDSLFDLADRLIGPEKAVQTTSEILPSVDLWATALQSVMRPPKSSLALLSPFGGAVHVIRTDDSVTADVIQYDSEGLSQALRISIYVAKLLTETTLAEHLGDLKTKIVFLLHVSVLLAEDNLSILGENESWKANAGLDVETLVLEFTSQANTILRRYWVELAPDAKGENASEYTNYLVEAEAFQKQSPSNSPQAYYSRLAYAKTHANLYELHGHSSPQATASEQLLRNARSEKAVLAIVTVLYASQQPLAGTQTLTRYCNELVADLTDVDIAAFSDIVLERMIVLSVILRTQDDAVDIIAKQRVIFLVKHLLSWLEKDLLAHVKAELHGLLSLLLPAMSDMYGEHWEHTLTSVLASWTTEPASFNGDTMNEDAILLTSSSLRLYASLAKLVRSDEPNDDLVEALQEKQRDVSSGLLHLLKNENGAPDELHAPLRAMHELLAREISRLPSQQIPSENILDLYPLLYTPSHAIQQAAFSLLHAYIPPAQEQISLDAALDNKPARLPDELLSLVLEAPTLEALHDAPFEHHMPLALQGYLSSWRLIFDHFSAPGASHRIRGEYVEQLKESGDLSGLLAFVFDFLGHSRGKSIDASRFDLTTYTPDTEPSPEKDAQWLLAHLYFLALTYLPSLVKAYYLELRSRQTVQAVESWTAKYVSPLVIAAALEGVAAWADKSSKEDPENERMSVKVGMRAKEVNVGYLVDEQTMAIRVVLPDAYPLEPARVLDVQRVAVKEEKWQSWLRNCQGVIAFSNGSITDGLAAWRKNVTGALKGQTECAICYSIISADKQLPTKRCPTCKHLFHSSCLFKWFKTSNANTCPLCRNAFLFNSVR